MKTLEALIENGKKEFKEIFGRGTYWSYEDGDSKPLLSFLETQMRRAWEEGGHQALHDAVPITWDCKHCQKEKE